MVWRRRYVWDPFGELRRMQEGYECMDWYLCKKKL